LNKPFTGTLPPKLNKQKIGDPCITTAYRQFEPITVIKKIENLIFEKEKTEFLSSFVYKSH